MFQYTDADLHVFASSLRDLSAPTSSRATPLATHNRHRFLWKLPRKYRERLAELYPTFLSKTETYGRVRIEAWIDYPHAVLQHRNVLAFMHHGGANSFIESGWCGVPQVILPQWVKPLFLYLLLSVLMNGIISYRPTATIRPRKYQRTG